ncbi:MAG TPA: phospholipid carrier-dependent glycosyltransferase [Anaerolineales bacterium]|nr:phospholipid carrier-dependent glycosyltransferase [Anaerolineales bacterium]
MKLRVTSRLAIFIALLLIAVTGFLLVLLATPEGAGLSDDSIAYIAGARSMVAGSGYREAWLASNQPVTHFPPAFPAVLSIFGFLGIDPLNAVRWVNALLFGLSAFVLGILAWRMTPSLTAGLVLAGLFVLNSDLLVVHAMAMSEPLFIFLTLLSIWMFDLYYERDQHWWLGACATFVGIAYLTRYSGLALIAAFVAALLILPGRWKQKLTYSALFVAGTLPWILGWAIRNRLVAENATNRVLAWHPITSENIHIGLRTVSEALIPVEAWRQEIFKQPFIIQALIVLILGAVLVWLSVRAWKYLSEPQQAPKRDGNGVKIREVISFTTGLFLFAYFASISSSMLMFDAATKFQLRILAPMYVCLLILLVYFGVWVRGKNRPLVVVLTFVVLAFSAYRLVNTINFMSRSGLGYASFQWYDSKAMDYLSELPTGVRIYTDEPAAVYLYTGRGNYVLPDRYDSATALPRPGFEEGLARMKNEILAGKAVLALFQGGEVNSEDAALLSEGLYLAHKSSGDEIYTAHP